MKYWILVLLAALSMTAGNVYAQDPFDTGDTIMIKDETVGMPARIVSIEAVPGEWLMGRSKYNEEIVIIGIKTDRLIAAKDVTITADFKDSLGWTEEQQITDSLPQTAGAVCNTCQQNSTPADLTPYIYPHGPKTRVKHLRANETYYSSFWMPKSFINAGGELNHISLVVTDSGKDIRGEMWIYHSNGDIPEAGGSWAPKGITAEDGHILLTRVGDTNSWTISS